MDVQPNQPEGLSKKQKKSLDRIEKSGMWAKFRRRIQYLFAFGALGSGGTLGYVAYQHGKSLVEKGPPARVVDLKQGTPVPTIALTSPVATEANIHESSKVNFEELQKDIDTVMADQIVQDSEYLRLRLSSFRRDALRMGHMYEDEKRPEQRAKIEEQYRDFIERFIQEVQVERTTQFYRSNKIAFDDLKKFIAEHPVFEKFRDEAAAFEPERVKGMNNQILLLDQLRRERVVLANISMLVDQAYTGSFTEMKPEARQAIRTTVEKYFAMRRTDTNQLREAGVVAPGDAEIALAEISSLEKQAFVDIATAKVAVHFQEEKFENDDKTLDTLHFAPGSALSGFERLYRRFERSKRVPHLQASSVMREMEDFIRIKEGLPRTEELQAAIADMKKLLEEAKKSPKTADAEQYRDKLPKNKPEALLLRLDLLMKAIDSLKGKGTNVAERTKLFQEALDLIYAIAQLQSENVSRLSGARDYFVEVEKSGKKPPSINFPGPGPDLEQPHQKECVKRITEVRFMLDAIDRGLDPTWQEKTAAAADKYVVGALRKLLKKLDDLMRTETFQADEPSNVPRALGLFDREVLHGMQRDFEVAQDLMKKEESRPSRLAMVIRDLQKGGKFEAMMKQAQGPRFSDEEIKRLLESKKPEDSVLLWLHIEHTRKQGLASYGSEMHKTIGALAKESVVANKRKEEMQEFKSNVQNAIDAKFQQIWDYVLAGLIAALWAAGAGASVYLGYKAWPKGKPPEIAAGDLASVAKTQAAILEGLQQKLTRQEQRSAVQDQAVQSISAELSQVLAFLKELPGKVEQNAAGLQELIAGQLARMEKIENELAQLSKAPAPVAQETPPPPESPKAPEAGESPPEQKA